MTRRDRGLCGAALMMIALIATPLPGAAQTASIGTQTPFNRYASIATPEYALDFEHGALDVYLEGNAALTSAGGEVIDGTTSLKIGPASKATLRSEALGMEPSRVYVIEYRYRILQPGNGDCLIDVEAVGPGIPNFSLGGVISALATDGADARSVQMTKPGQTFQFATCGATAVIDDIRIFRHDVEVRFSEPTLLDFAFPRLANYSLMTPDGVAYLNGVPQDQVEAISARYDLLLGSNSDHLMSATGWVRRIRQLNPDIRILPYKQTFMVQNDGYGYGTYSGVNDLFNRGISPDWFMRKPSGEPLAEVDFPANVQLDHTPFSPQVGGITANQYAADFFARTMFPSGLWDGLHFDQPEWYINPLLGNPPPPIDLNRDGVADSVATVQKAWTDGFRDFFKGVTRRTGYQQLLFGNAGYIPGNPSILGMLNGWEMEVVSPYRIAPGGDWVTDEASSWYRLLNNYLHANVYARAPQIVSLEFTGRDLGQPNGGMTPNFYPGRFDVLEPRDFRRMRLGLTTALLGNGFFEYDLVDNTTAPLWFDEYSVSNGVATGNGTGKGYLGQPLGDATELDYPYRVVADVDFESAPPAEFFPGPGTLSTTPSEVISGRSSLVVRQNSADEDKWLFYNATALTPGKTYQLFADYRILGYTPTTFRGLAGIGFTDQYGQLQPERSASLYLPDTDGPGQQGTLRASVRVTSSGVHALGGLSDTGAIAIDNVRLIEGPGGVWRRDFENGIVLVNPTPETQFVPQASIAGSLSRTAIRRLQGAQQPLVNSGAPVTDGLWLGPADGIVLLASPIGTAPLTAPAQVSATPFGSDVVVLWAKSTGPVAGYTIRYGESPTDLTRSAVAGPGSAITLEGLHPGATYHVQVAAFDFRGRTGPAALLVQVTMPGSAERRPQFVISPTTPAIVAGGYMRIEGSDLADVTIAAGAAPFATRLGSTVVQVNGVDAPLVSVSPASITFVVPWEIAGSEAVVNVIRDGIEGGERLVPAAAARPWILTWDPTSVAIALRADGSAVTDQNPAAAGETIDVVAIGLGAVAEHPDNGAAAGGRVGATAELPTVLVGGIAADVRSAALIPGLVGMYRVSVTVPLAVSNGTTTLELRSGGTSSNLAVISCR